MNVPVIVTQVWAVFIASDCQLSPFQHSLKSCRLVFLHLRYVEAVPPASPFPSSSSVGCLDGPPSASLPTPTASWYPRVLAMRLANQNDDAPGDNKKSSRPPMRNAHSGGQCLRWSLYQTFHDFFLRHFGTATRHPAECLDSHQPQSICDKHLPTDVGPPGLPRLRNLKPLPRRHVELQVRECSAQDAGHSSSYSASS